MKKKYLIVTAILLLLSIAVSIQSPVNAKNYFVLNGNALSETEGYETQVGMNYENNQIVVSETNNKINVILSNQLSEQETHGSGKSLKLDTISLSSNVVTNIAAEDSYIEVITSDIELETEIETTTEATTKPTTTKPTTTETTKKDTTEPKKNTNPPTSYTKTNSNIIEGFDPKASNVTYMGNFKLTAYCPCYSCSEGWGNSTASGAKAKANRTIAVDPKVIPYGTKVIIERNGVYYEYVAEDCGGAIKNKIIDVYFASHSETTNFGVKYGNVYIIK